MNNLKQIGLAFRVFSNDNDDHFPYFCPSNGLAYRNETDAWLHFQTMSNELGSARILICPEDRERLASMAMDFTSNSVPDEFGLAFQRNKAVSYFVGLDADETRPRMFLSGDRNVETNTATLRGSVLDIGTNRPPGWLPRMHTNSGNIAFADGSVQTMNSAFLAREFTNYPYPSFTNRLLLPSPTK
ncbi:MAG: type II secretion system protein [Verrucomicrobia bacterium]|nr:type II secretion system protein [Verrucomicrobiota bacterium]